MPGSALMALADQMTLLYYADFSQDAAGLDDSFVEGMINKNLKKYFNIIVVYYSKTTQETKTLKESNIIVPYARQKKLIQEISAFVDISRIDLVLVRNQFSVLKNTLKFRKQYGYKVGFHPTFPHALRRYHEAKLTGRNIFRKFVEYRIKLFYQNRLIEISDFIISSAPNMVASEALRRKMNFHKVYNGVDVDLLPDFLKTEKKSLRELRFVYIGIVDRARQFDVVLHAFDDLSSTNWQLDIFTTRTAYAKAVIAETMVKHPHKVRVNAALQRSDLFKVLPKYDVGVNLIPVNELYNVSDPIKLIEYYACGLPEIMTHLPACLELLGKHDCGWFTPFNRESIRATLQNILNMDRKKIYAMGMIGQGVILAERNYSKLAYEFAEYLYTCLPNRK